MEGQGSAEPWKDQRTPALAIVARGDQIRVVSATHYKVASQSSPERSYSVRRTADGWLCACAHYEQAQRDCIHILAVKVAGPHRAGSAEGAKRRRVPK